ncbi:MAG: PaaI family thioesterase [Lautropia sp.]
MAKDTVSDDDETRRHLTAEGWAAIEDKGFVQLVGPFFRRGEGAGLRFCFPTADKHHNLRGVLQGGALMTFADRTMGTAARTWAGGNASATVQLNVQFVRAVEIGALVETCPVVVSATRNLIFMRADFLVGTSIVATAAGIWKIFGTRGAANPSTIQDGPNPDPARTETP